MEEVSAITGVSQPRLHNYRTDPAFEQLIAEYRPKISAVDVEKYDYIRDVATTTLRNVVEMVAEEVEEAINSGERIPMRQLLPLIRDYGDRFGYGKHTHNTNTQVTFAIEMEEARIRTERARTIEGSASPSLPQTRVSEPHPTYSPESLQPVVASAGLPRRV